VTKDGRVVAYLGDDERFDYLYKFVSDGNVKSGDSRHAREHNKRLLDSGTLYVAKFTGDSPPAEIDGSGTLPSDGEFDGSGEWIPWRATTGPSWTVSPPRRSTSSPASPRTPPA
jgi:secreted PhoX family phosphatase